jgi:excisionase family DNA binding protein
MKNLLNIDETAKRLGVSPRTIRGWLYRGELAYVRVGKKAIRIEESVVERLIEKGRHEAIGI